MELLPLPEITVKCLWPQQRDGMAKGSWLPALLKGKLFDYYSDLEEWDVDTLKRVIL